MKTKVYAVDEKHPAYWPTGPLIRFLRPEKAVRCVACGKKLAGRLLDGREWSEFPAVEMEGGV